MMENIDFEKGLAEIQEKLKRKEVMAVVVISKKSEKEFELSSIMKGHKDIKQDTNIKLNIATGFSQQAALIYSKLKEEGRITEAVDGQAYR